VMDAGIASE